MSTWETIVVIIVASGFSNFVATYMSKKGENLAIHEDLKVLTATAKSIEHNYETLAENLRSSNQIKSEAVVKYDSAKADLLLIFLHEVNAIFLRLQYAPIELLIDWRSESNTQEWRSYIKDTGTLFNTLELTYNKLFMFFDEDHPIPKAAASLYGITIPIGADMINLSSKLESDILVGRSLLQLQQSGEEESQKVNEILKKYTRKSSITTTVSTIAILNIKRNAVYTLESFENTINLFKSSSNKKAPGSG